MYYLNRPIQLLFLTCLISLLAAMPARANTLQTVVYIDPVFYQHHERLLHPYYNHWFSQGPTLENVAVDALKSQSRQVKLCQAGQVANQVIALSPTMFYNPQVRRYYSTIKAHVYAGDGSLIGEYVGKGEQAGNMSVDVGLQGDMKAAYMLAMDDLMQTLRFSQDKVSKSDVQLPCQIVGAQTKPNYYR